MQRRSELVGSRGFDGGDAALVDGCRRRLGGGRALGGDAQERGRKGRGHGAVSRSPKRLACGRGLGIRACCDHHEKACAGDDHQENRSPQRGRRKSS